MSSFKAKIFRWRSQIIIQLIMKEKRRMLFIKHCV